MPAACKSPPNADAPSADALDKLPMAVENSPPASASLPIATAALLLARAAVPSAMPSVEPSVTVAELPMASPLVALTVLNAPIAAPNDPVAPTLLKSPRATEPVAPLSVWLPVPIAVLNPPAAITGRDATPPLPMAVEERPEASAAAPTAVA